ncbi:MAG: hypothetical protein AAB558_01120 [Patescibacteria group bacterium]
MLNQFLISLTLAAHVLGLTLPQVIEEGVYVVPSLLTPATGDVTELRVLPAVVDAVSRQAEPISSVEYRFLPVSTNRPQPPYKVGTSTGPLVTAKSAVLLDQATGMVLWQKNPDSVRPIASLTKLMTAVVYLKHQPLDGMNHIHTLAPEENAVIGYNLTFPSGTQLTTGSLFGAMLVGSLNNTALALNGATGLSTTEFIAQMNQLAEEFGMRRTTFVDQTGVNNKNVATAGDVAVLAKQAFAESDINQFADQTSLEVRDVSGEKVRTVQATNQLAGNTDVELQGAKTGTTAEAGYCYVFQVVIEGHSVIGVILGATSDESRFSDAIKLIDWTSQQFDWK